LVPQENKTICLAMIVKNESKVIERCLDSVKDFVNHVVICDTGSTDGTQEIIKKWLKKNNITGDIHDREWVHFAHNRTEAFKYAKGKCDYIMTLDADEVFAPYINGEADLTKRIFSVDNLKAERIYVMTAYNQTRYLRAQFFKDSLNWGWEQPVHEHTVCLDKTDVDEAVQKGCCVYVTPEGARSQDKQKYLKDALVFENWLLDHPEDSRAWFYLCQSYQDAKMPERALAAFPSAIKTSRWVEEKYMLHLRKARWLDTLGRPKHEIYESLVNAYETHPLRCEAPLGMIVHHYNHKNWKMILLLGTPFVDLNDVPPHTLFAEKAAWTWRIKDYVSIAHFYTENYEESLKYAQAALNFKNIIPEHEIERIQGNITHAKNKIKE
jgi:glycosyltransferase involved in cell wall biosynthesis